MAKKGEKLNPKEEMFCQLYGRSAEFFGNATQSYISAYNLTKKQANSASVLSLRLLGKVKIRERVKELMDLKISDVIADEELAFVVKQRKDFPSKIAAVKEYNRVNKRVDESPKIKIFNLNPERQEELKKILKKNV